MRLIAWLLTTVFGLAGIALRVQGGIPPVYAVGNGFELGNGLLILAALACPFFWAPDTGMLGWMGQTRKTRVMLSLALLLSVPLLLPIFAGR